MRQRATSMPSAEVPDMTPATMRDFGWVVVMRRL